MVPMLLLLLNLILRALSYLTLSQACISVQYSCIVSNTISCVKKCSIFFSFGGGCSFTIPLFLLISLHGRIYNSYMGIQIQSLIVSYVRSVCLTTRWTRRNQLKQWSRNLQPNICLMVDLDFWIQLLLLLLFVVLSFPCSSDH